MSRFLPDRLFIGIEPDRVALVRQSGLFKKRLIADTVLPLDIRTAEGVQAFGQALANERWRGCRARIVLADRLLHYFVVDRPQGARHAQEIELAVAMRFEDVFGEAATDWNIRADLTPFAANDLACACRKSLLKDLQQQCKAAHIGIETITPFAVSEWNRRPRQAKRSGQWFVVVCRDGLWAARRNEKAWLCARQLQWRESLAELPQLLQREALRLALDDEKPKAAVVGLTGRNTVAIPADQGQFSWLGAALWPGQSAAWSEIYRLALSSEWPQCA